MPEEPRSGAPAGRIFADSGRQLGVREFVGVVIRRRWIILGVFVPILVVALVATLTATNSTTVSARIMIETRQPEDPTFYGGSIDYDVLMSSAAQVVISIPVAERAAAALADSLPVLRQQGEAFAGVASTNDLRDLILKHEDCSQVGETNILDISVIHPSPRFGFMAVRAVTDAYIDYSIESKKNAPAVEYYSDQIRQVQADLDSLFTVRAGILGEYGIIGFRENVQTNAAQIVEIERSYFTEMANREALEARLGAIKKAIAADPDFMPSIGTQENQDLLRIKINLDEEEAKLVKMRQEYNDDTAWVVRQQALVDELRAKFYRERGNYARAIEIDLAATRSREAALAEAVRHQREMIQDYPVASQRLGSVDAAIDSQRDLLEMLQTKKGEVRLKAGTDARISNVVKLDEPSVAGLVGESKRVVYLAVASLFGLTLGLLGALFAESQDHRIYNKSQLEQNLHVRVLGSISSVGDR